ncbi:O-antigen ligase family protein [Terrisporobacter sp.]|uniref:O-antigen ligase family protein n=1 Tax=Terrisporobacter sp. TaxID=1965305 RepID=UPI00262A1CB3|nr:O-antigen ligase family protein [Terrisporobacter sp.]
MNFISKEERILYYILSITVLIDAINGLMISTIGYTSISFGMFFRTIIMTIFLLYIFKYSKKSIIILSLVSIPFLMTSFISFFSESQGMRELIYDIKDIFITMYFIVTLSLFRILAKENKIREEIIYKSIINNGVILLISLLLASIFNVGSSSYEATAGMGDTVGFKGTFYSLNGLSIV